MIQSIVQSYDYKKKIGKGGGGGNIPEPALADAGKVLKATQTGPSAVEARWQPETVYTLPSGTPGQVLTRYGTGTNEAYFTDIKQVPTPDTTSDYGKVLKTDGTSYFWGTIDIPQTVEPKKFHKRKARVLKSTVEQRNGTIEWSFDKLYIDEDSEWKNIATYTDEIIVALPDSTKNVYSPTVYDASDNVITGNFSANAPFEIKCGLSPEWISNAFFDSNPPNNTSIDIIQPQSIGNGEYTIIGNWISSINIGSTAGTMTAMFNTSVAGPYKFTTDLTTQKCDIELAGSGTPSTIALKDILFEDAVDTDYYEIDVITVDYV